MDRIEEMGKKVGAATLSFYIGLLEVIEMIVGSTVGIVMTPTEEIQRFILWTGHLSSKE